MKSIWQKQIKLPRFDSLNEDKKCEVLIIGGGMAGILTAFLLEQNGIDYILVEAEKICGGTTGLTTAKITSQHGLIYSKIYEQRGIEAARLYYEANERAIEDFCALDRLYPCDFERTDSFIYSQGNAKKLEAELLALEKIGASASFCKDLPLPFKTVGAISFKNQAQFNPLMLIEKIVPQLNIYENSRIVGFDGKCFFTEKHRIYAKKTVVATHFPFINKHGSFFVKMYQHRSYVTALEGIGNIDGIYMDENDKGLSFRSYKNMLLLGGGGHRTGKSGGGWQALDSFAQKNYPSAKTVCKWAAQDTVTLDGVSYIGQYSKTTPDLYVATGFNKWGMSTSMVAARLLTDMLSGKTNPCETLFSPNRKLYIPKLTLNCAHSFINVLNPIGPRCAHLGCALRWNKYEHSWDCSCHGSRFTKEGRVLNNPANCDMKD